MGEDRSPLINEKNSGKSKINGDGKIKNKRWKKKRNEIQRKINILLPDIDNQTESVQEISEIMTVNEKSACMEFIFEVRQPELRFLNSF